MTAPVRFPVTQAPADVVTKRRAFRFASDNLGPPPQGYFVTEEQLNIQVANSFSSLALTVTARVLDPSDASIHIITAAIAPAATRAFVTTLIPLVEGFLLSASVSTLSSSKRGQTYVTIGLNRGGANGILAGVGAAGYVSTTDVVAWWPGSTAITHETDYPAFLRVIVGTLPGAGVEITETVPTGANWRLRGFRAVFTAAAGGGNRQPTLLIDDGANTWHVSPSQAVVAGAGSATYMWAPGFTQTALQNAIATQPIPSDTVLPSGSRIRTSTANLAGGDTWAAPIYEVEETLTT